MTVILGKLKYKKKKTTIKKNVPAKTIKDKVQDVQIKKLTEKVKRLKDDPSEYSSALSYVATTLVGPNSAGGGITSSAIGLSQLTISQGDTQITREGNQLRVRYWRMKMYVSCSKAQWGLTDFDAPMVFRLVIARQRNGNVSDFDTNVNSASFGLFRNGSTVSYPQNQQQYLYRPLNTDTYDVKFDKLVKLLPLTASDNIHNITTSRPSKRQYTINLSKYFPKIIKYAGSSTTAEIRPYSVFIACAVPEGFQASSTAYSAATSPKINVEMFHTLKFSK